MNYTEEEHDAMMDENTPFDGDALHDEYMSSHGNLTRVSDMATLENQVAFEALKQEMDWGTPIDLEFKILNSYPYYKFVVVSFSEDESFSETKNLHLNKDILNYMYNYLESNVLGVKTPNDFVGVKNVSEKYLLHLLKRDRQNGKLTHDPETGYKSTYNRISINYGKLPHTPEELYAKLESI